MSTLAALRMQIRALEGHFLETSDGEVLPFDDPRLNAGLAQGGLQIGALHEFRSPGLEAELAPSVTGFVATVTARLLRKREGLALWAFRRADCYPAGFVRFGLDPDRIVFVECRRDEEILSVMEEALHSRTLAAVLGEAGALTLKEGRRLDAAARQSGVTALLVRRALFASSKAGLAPSGAAATRWRVSACAGGAAAPQDWLAGLGPPRWRLDLEYCRNGRAAAWIVEALNGSDGEGIEAGHVRVVAELRDEACQSEAAPAGTVRRTACAS